MFRSNNLGHHCSAPISPGLGRAVRIALVLVLILAAKEIWAASDPGPVRQVEVDGSVSYKIYLVKKGDTLEKIAARPEIYSDGRKWYLIYYMNREELMAVRAAPERKPRQALAPGTMLAVMRPGEARQRGRGLAGRDRVFWIVNVRSSLDPGRLDGLIVGLADRGFFPYITTFQRNSRTWYRLRIGFFPSQDAAGGLCA